MTTEITVRGLAQDTRDPDRAVMSIVVHAEARDWAAAHVVVSGAMTTLNASIDALKAAHPDAIEWSSTGQASQTSYSNKGILRFSEQVRVNIAFVDFPAMSEWVFASTNETVQLRYVSWELSREVRETVRAELGQAAIADARARAETFADAAGLKIIGVVALADPGLLPGVNPNPFGNQVEYGMARAASGSFIGSAEAEHTIDLTPEPIETEASVEARFIAE